MKLLLDGKGPRYEQLARAIRALILDGTLVPASRLPSTRALALALKMSRKSVLEAYDLLAAEELISSRIGVGTLVAELAVPIQAPARKVRAQAPSRYANRLRHLPELTLAGMLDNARYNFQYGAPHVNPRIYLSWSRKLAAASRRAGPGYAAARGLLALRRAIAEYLARRRGLICSANEIVIVSGTQQAMTLATRVLLNEGDRAVVEDPFYQLAVHVLMAHGARISYVRTDMEGLCVAEIPDGPSRLAIVTPSHQFPSGVVMSTSRRIELLHWACRTGAWIMEDDYDSEFHGGERPLPTLRSLDMAERVIYVGTFSKTLFPGLRLGYIVCPSELLEDFVSAKRLDDVGSSVLEQMALATFIQSGLYERQLRRSVREVVLRRHALVEALRRRFRDQVEIGPHSAGMHLVLWFPNLTHERLATGLARAAAAGVSAQLLRPHCHIPPKRPGILLGYAALSTTQIRSGVEILWESLRSV